MCISKQISLIKDALAIVPSTSNLWICNLKAKYNILTFFSTSNSHFAYGVNRFGLWSIHMQSMNIFLTQQCTILIHCAIFLTKTHIQYASRKSNRQIYRSLHKWNEQAEIMYWKITKFKTKYLLPLIRKK